MLCGGSAGALVLLPGRVPGRGCQAGFFYALFLGDEDGILLSAEYNLDQGDLVPAYLAMAWAAEE